MSGAGQLRMSSLRLAAAAMVAAVALVMAAGQLQVAEAGYTNGAPFNSQYYCGWRPENVWLADAGHTINIKLDNNSGSGFRSINSYLHGFVSMSIKLVPRNSAGVVVAYYMTSPRENTTTDWDEIDFEFLGNVTGQPWILQTNIFTNGTGGREQRIFLWFDPTTDYHSYSILWNAHQILWYVDSMPIRVYRNTPITEATYPKWKPMTVYSSIWNGDSWATRGGLEKIDWTYAPFIASYTNFYMDACQWNQPGPAPSCFYYSGSSWWDMPNKWTMNDFEKSAYTNITQEYTVYNYCDDYNRYPVQMPECAIPPWD